MFGFVPKEMFFTKGVGKHREKLTSFELALRSAGIAACNLVRVSSIFPPKCRILSRTEGTKRLEPGQVTFVVMSEAATREPHRLIAATVGVAIPRDRDLYGYLSEHHSFGESEDIAALLAVDGPAQHLGRRVAAEVVLGDGPGTDDLVIAGGQQLLAVVGEQQHVAGRVAGPGVQHQAGAGALTLLLRGRGACQEQGHETGDGEGPGAGRGGSHGLIRSRGRGFTCSW